MAKRFAILTMTMIGLLGSMVTRADAQTLGPYCFSNLPFSNEYLLYFTATGVNQYVGSGRDYITGAPVTASMYLSGNSALIGVSKSLSPTGTAHSVLISANISTVALSGPGRCETVNTTGGCGTGTTVNWVLTACPAGSLSAATAPLPPGARLDSGSR